MHLIIETDKNHYKIYIYENEFKIWVFDKYENIILNTISLDINILIETIHILHKRLNTTSTIKYVSSDIRILLLQSNYYRMPPEIKVDTSSKIKHFIKNMYKLKKLKHVFNDKIFSIKYDGDKLLKIYKNTKNGNIFVDKLKIYGLYEFGFLLYGLSSKLSLSEEDLIFIDAICNIKDIEEDEYNQSYLKNLSKILEIIK